MQRCSSHIFECTLYTANISKVFSRVPRAAKRVPLPFCRNERLEAAGWQTIQEYVRALHFFYFHSENHLTDFGFANKQEAVECLTKSTRKLYELAEKLVPFVLLKSGRKKGTIYSKFGTPSNVGLAHILPMLFEQGVNTSITNTDVAERANGLVRDKARSTLMRGATGDGKGNPYNLLRQFDTQFHLHRKLLPKLVEKRITESKRKLERRRDTFGVLRMRERLNTLNSKSTADIVGRLIPASQQYDAIPPSGDDEGDDEEDSIHDGSVGESQDSAEETDSSSEASDQTCRPSSSGNQEADVIDGSLLGPDEQDEDST